MTTPNLRLRTADFEQLTARELDAWHTLRAKNPVLDSPYFHPAFAAAVHAEGPAVRVAVAVDSQGEVHGLLPFHADRGVARPVGWPAADFQGPICAPGTSFPVAELLAGIGAKSFAFDHLLDEHTEFSPWVENRRPSPFLEVSGGMDGYLSRASRSGKENMGQARRRSVKATREHGELRFEADNRDPALLDEVIRLKRGQYAATGARDYFADPRRAALLHRLLTTREGSFGGLLSTVHVGHTLLAAHFGLLDQGVLHWWFPVYDPDFGKLAPGWILLRGLVTAAPSLAVDRIDLGRGEDEYKRRAMTGQSMVCEGQLSKGTLLRAFYQARRSAVTTAKASPVAPQLRALVRKFR
jgi:CelD/BcsL family acetyltransferase involved in cellulose biosynthesis